MASLSAALRIIVVALIVQLTVDFIFRMSFTFKVHIVGGVLITGASSGIGEHAAAALVASGYTVFAGVRKQKDGIRLENTYPGIRHVILDVTSQQSIDEAVAHVQTSLEELDLNLIALVNNAGVQKDMPVELQDPANDRWTFDVNVFGLLDTTRAFIPLLRETGEGARIVNMGSLAGVLGAPGSATYAGSKFAVEGISDSLRQELQTFGISVSLLQPGYVLTKMGAKAHESSQESYGVSQAHYNIYRHVFEGFFAKDKLLASAGFASSPQVTSGAILHAIQSPSPKTRYAVANVDGFPAWFMTRLKATLPDRAMDFLTLNF